VTCLQSACSQLDSIDLIVTGATLRNKHETAIDPYWEPDPDRSRHSAGSLDSNDSEFAVVQELCQRGGTVDADVGPAHDRPSTPPQDR